MKFKWLDALRGRPTPAANPETPEDKRDTGEDAYESFEEAEDEASPSGQPRINTDDI